MANHFKFILPRGLAIVCVVSVGLVVLLTSIQLTAHVQARRIESSSSSLESQPSFLYRFDSSAETFFTFTLPLDSIPNSIAVSGTHPTHVWIAESGRDQIGHLVYTDTTDFAWQEYPVTTTNDSRPFRLTLDGNFVWFTERGANRIGRLNATTQEIDEFYDHGLSPDAGLADIKIASDGEVWVTEQWSNRLLQLTITSTTDYAFHEYTHTLLMSPFGLAIRANDDILVAAPGAHRIGWFIPSSRSFAWSYVPNEGSPTELMYFFVNTGKPHSEVWFSDPTRNSLGLLFLSTTAEVRYFNPITQATGLARDSQNAFWLTQQDRQGDVARVTITSALSSQIDSYQLPTSGLLPTSIAVASDDGVWLVAYTPYRTYLPTIVRH